MLLPPFRDLFRAAAEAGPHHILKMYNTNGSVVNISPQLEANTRDSRYRLEVVASDPRGEPAGSGGGGNKLCLRFLSPH